MAPTGIVSVAVSVVWMKVVAAFCYCGYWAEEEEEEEKEVWQGVGCG